LSFNVQVHRDIPTIIVEGEIGSEDRQLQAAHVDELAQVLPSGRINRRGEVEHVTHG
jgi:hypothetical protein